MNHLLKFIFASSCTLLLLSSSSQSWQTLTFPSTQSLTAGSFPTGQNGYVISSYYPKIWRTSNGGTTWDSLDLGYSLLDIDFINADTGFVLARDGSAFKLMITYNGGGLFAEVPIDVESFTSCSMLHFKDVSTGFVFTTDAYIAGTSNSGLSWDSLALNTYFMPNDKSTLSGDTMILGGWDGTFGYMGAICRSFDGGNNWEVVIHDSLYSIFNGIHFINGSNGYGVQNMGWGPQYSALSHTTDAGDNWTILYSDTSFVFEDVYMKSTTEGYIAGTEMPSGGHILKTTDGISWNTDYTTPYSVRKFFKGGTNLFGIGDGGTIIKLSLTNSVEELNKENLHFFPNPSAGTVFLNHNYASYEIYDNNGRQVKSGITSATGTMKIDDLDNGIYFIRLDTYTGVMGGRIVLQKN